MVADVEAVLRIITPVFGVAVADPAYNTNYRNPILSYLTAESLLILYSRGGVPAVQAEVFKLRLQGVI